MPKQKEIYMTGDQYAKAIKKLGLSQRSAGKFLGADERTSRRYIADEAVIPKPTAMLLRVMIKHDIKPEDLA